MSLEISFCITLLLIREEIIILQVIIDLLRKDSCEEFPHEWKTGVWPVVTRRSPLCRILLDKNRSPFHHPIRHIPSLQAIIQTKNYDMVQSGHLLEPEPSPTIWSWCLPIRLSPYTCLNLGHINIMLPKSGLPLPHLAQPLSNYIMSPVFFVKMSLSYCIA